MVKKINFDDNLNLMVALDLTEMDEVLLSYVSFLSKIWNIDNLYFIHNIKKYKLNDLYDDMLKNEIKVEDIVEKALEKTIKANYTGSVPFSLITTMNDYTESILSEMVKEYHIDLMLAGNKSELQGTGAVNQKMVRLLYAQVLLVPEETRHQLKKILIPTDFSAASAKSFSVANSLIHRTNGEIEAVHVYNIPSYFFPYINTEKAINKTEKFLREKVVQFKKKNKISEDVQFRSIDREELSVVEAIEKHAEKESFDCIVVSARGSNNLTSLFIGSITNDLLIRNRKMPLLVVK